MLGTVLGRYRIDEMLGAGGMGVVWRAHDPQLDRDVALKVLPDPLVANGDARARMLREARMAAALNHPHIVTVYEVSEAGGHVYIAMEYLSGRSLSQVMAAGGIPFADAMRFAGQIAAALACAHEQGVVHRDVKPSNVLVGPRGDVKVLDFGLATRVVSDDSDTRSLDVTQARALVGTPSAMAPELWRGARADTRSDVWAFGVLLHTLLSGTPPFAGKTSHEMSLAILTTEPPPLPRAVPPAVCALVARCLQRDPERRFRSALELNAALEAISAVTAAPVSLAGGSAQTPAPRARRRPAAVAVGAVMVIAVAAAALAWWMRSHAPGQANRPIMSLAVLPLDNFSHDAEQQYFADGMTDELITRLAQLGTMRVISRTSVMRFRGAALALPEIARQLGADAIVEGSVQQSGGRVRITAQLVRAANDEHLWAHSYEREVGDALALQDEVAEAIAGEVAGTLAPISRRRPAALPGSTASSGALQTTRQPAAVQAYLRGRDSYQRWTPTGARKAVQFFDQALAIDSTFAAASAGRGAALLAITADADTAQLARTAIAKALTIDPGLGEAHAALAKFLFMHDWNFTESEREFRRALELNPSDADAHHHYSHLLAALGRVPEAREQAALMFKLDPLAPASLDHMAWVNSMSGHLDEARAWCDKLVALDPTYGDGYPQRARIELAARQWGALRRTLEQGRNAGAELDPLAFELVTAAEGSRNVEGIRVLHKVLAPADKYIWDLSILASWALVFRNRDEAFAELDAAVRARSYSVLFINLEPALAELRTDPRYTALRRRMHLPD